MSIPTVSRVSPSSGPGQGGTTVTVTGTNLAGGTVYFGGSQAPSSTCTSDTSCTATSPNGSGTVDVTVQGNTGTSATTTADQFSFLLTAAAPGNFKAVAKSKAVVLSWTAPTSDLGGPVTGYDIYEATTPGAQPTKPLNSKPVTSLSHTVTGLVDGRTYYFEVAAVNEAGAGPFSSQAPATPEATPKALKATTGTTSITLTWNAPTPVSVSPLEGYDVYEVSMSGVVPASPVNSTPITTKSYKVTGLTEGVKYYFEVEAVYAPGNSGPSNKVAAKLVATVPSAPLDVTATAGHQIEVAWQAPSSNGGSPITGYDVFEGTSSGHELLTPVNAKPVTGKSYQVTGLTPGKTYYFVVEAINKVGKSPKSNEASAGA
jgi:predicted phage tail protein